MDKLRALSKLVCVVVPMALQPVLTFILLVLVARYATQETYGALAFGMVMVTLLSGFSDLGLRDYLLSRGAAQDGLCSGENLFHPSLAGFTVLASAILLYTHFSAVSADAAHLLLALLPEAFAYAVLQRSLFFHYQTQDRLVRFSFLDSIFKSSPFLMKIVIFWLTGDLPHAILVGSLMALACYAAWFHLRCVRPGTFFAAGAGFATAMARMGQRWHAWLPFTLSFLSFFLYFGLDRLLVEARLGAEALALYAAACSFIAIGQIVVQGFWSLYMPKISRGAHEGGQRRFLMLALALSLAMVIAYQLFAGYAFPLFYPEVYAYAAHLLGVMSLYFLFRLVNVVFEMYWVAKGRYGAFVKVRVACGLLSVTLNYTLLGRYGLMAPAVILICCEMLITLYVLASEFKGDSTPQVAPAP